MTTYDEVPYFSLPFVQSHPSRLATVATLLGMSPAPILRCRVLEVGCSSGGNLIPMAEQFPESRFVGIDVSARQIADGLAKARPLNLPNLELLERDLSTVGRELGRFDYILAHGVYSWVPGDVRESLLTLLRESLSPNGVAFVSYNTFPGWHARGIIRDLMLYRTRSFTNAKDKVHEARRVLDTLAQAVSKEHNPYGQILADEVTLLADKHDSYLFHDHMEQVNEPVYFHEFVEGAQRHALQYLGEANFGSMWTRTLSPKARAAVGSLSTDPIEVEQYIDFVRNRSFRQTLLCHPSIRVDRSFASGPVFDLFVSSPAKPERPPVDLASSERMSFAGPHATTRSSDPIVKAALTHLAEIWPRSIAVRELLTSARARVPETDGDAARLADAVLWYYAARQVELSVIPDPFTLDISGCPMTSTWARSQATEANVVTTLRHTTQRLSAVERHIVRHLDGKHDAASLVSLVCDLASQGGLTIKAGEAVVDDPARRRQIVADAMGPTLNRLAEWALVKPASPR